MNPRHIHGINMYKNHAPDGRRNICGHRVAALRKSKKPKLSQRGLAGLLQLEGLDVDKNAVQRIESGQRFVTDIEIKVLARVFGVSVEQLLEE